MASYYFDSSAVAKEYVTEIGSVWVRQIVAATAGNKIYTARVTGAEVVSAFFLRARVGTLANTDAQAAAQRFKADFRHQYDIVTVTEALVELAMDLVEKHTLRGYDAVQLAAALVIKRAHVSAPAPPITFVSADARLNRAATAEGLLVEDPNTNQ